MAAGLLAFPSRQFAPSAKLGHSVRFTYVICFEFNYPILSERSGRQMLPAERSALYTLLMRTSPSEQPTRTKTWKKIEEKKEKHTYVKTYIYFASADIVVRAGTYKIPEEKKNHCKIKLPC